LKLHWETIKSALHNKVIQVSYMVVILLPIILELVETSNHRPIISSNIFQIFYSGILLLIVYLIYSIAVPNAVSHYTSREDYIAQKRVYLVAALPDMKKNIVMANLDDTQEESKKKIGDLNKAILDEQDAGRKAILQTQLDKLVNDLHPACVDNFLSNEWYEADTQKNKPTLIICYILFAIAAILALLVFGHRIQIVINYQLNQP
jgi:hypothetical protein